MLMCLALNLKWRDSLLPLQTKPTRSELIQYNRQLRTLTLSMRLDRLESLRISSTTFLLSHLLLGNLQWRSVQSDGHYSYQPFVLGTACLPKTIFPLISFEWTYTNKGFCVDHHCQIILCQITLHQLKTAIDASVL